MQTINMNCKHINQLIYFYENLSGFPTLGLFVVFFSNKKQTFCYTHDDEKLKFFTTKVKTRDYAKISLSGYQRLSVDDRSSVLRNYYQDVSKNYSVSSGNIIMILFYFCHISLFQQRKKSKKRKKYFLLS